MEDLSVKYCIKFYNLKEDAEPRAQAIVPSMDSVFQYMEKFNEIYGYISAFPIEDRKEF